MSFVDYGIILFYFAVVIGLGFWYQKRASKSLGGILSGGQEHPLAGPGNVRFGIKLRHYRDHVDYFHPVCSGNEIYVVPLDVGIFNGGFFPQLYG